MSFSNDDIIKYPDGYYTNYFMKICKDRHDMYLKCIKRRPTFINYLDNTTNTANTLNTSSAVNSVDLNCTLYYNNLFQNCKQYINNILKN